MDGETLTSVRPHRFSAADDVSAVAAGSIEITALPGVSVSVESVLPSQS